MKDMSSISRGISPEKARELLELLRNRFEQNRPRHQGLDWEKMVERLQANPSGLITLYEMEQTGGEPDVVGYDENTGRFLFMDCSPESPIGRRNVCYDREGLESRKEHKPGGSAMEMAASMGAELLTEEQYRNLQQLGEFDNKTSSWLKTPEDIRSRGGALFGDRRYGHVFVYHNGAQSYYAVRGFRVWVEV